MSIQDTSKGSSETPKSAVFDTIKQPILWLAGLAFDIIWKDYQVSGLRFAIPHDLTDRAFRSRFLRDRYEGPERLYVSRYVKPGMRVMELGACIGVVSAITNKALDFSPSHVVVEANPRLIPWLSQNLKNNGCKTAVEHCLVSRSSDGTFYLHDLIVGGSNYRPTASRVTVPVLTVEELEAKHGVKFNVLIMDIEGGEHGFVMENKDWLRAIDLAIIEVHDAILSPEELGELRHELEAAGLSFREKLDLTEVWQRSPQ